MCCFGYYTLGYYLYCRSWMNFLLNISADHKSKRSISFRCRYCYYYPSPVVLVVKSICYVTASIDLITCYRCYQYCFYFVEVGVGLEGANATAQRWQSVKMFCAMPAGCWRQLGLCLRNVSKGSRGMVVTARATSIWIKFGRSSTNLTDRNKPNYSRYRMGCIAQASTCDGT
jgi:hypothetical protein